jgi:hypothetical protein
MLHKVHGNPPDDVALEVKTCSGTYSRTLLRSLSRDQRIRDSLRGKARIMDFISGL